MFVWDWGWCEIIAWEQSTMIGRVQIHKLVLRLFRYHSNGSQPTKVLIQRCWFKFGFPASVDQNFAGGLSGKTTENLANLFKSLAAWEPCLSGNKTD